MTKTDIPEMEGEVEVTGPTDGSIKTLVRLAREQLDLLVEEAKIMRDLVAVQAKLKTNMEVDLPLALDEAGVAAFPLSNGVIVELKETTRASISEERKPKAHAWLIKNKLEDLIKREIKILFGRDETKWAEKFMRDMSKRKKPLNHSLKEWVDSNTMSAQVRRMREAFKEAGKNPDDAIPKDLFGIYVARQGVVKIPSDSAPVKSKARSKQ